MSRFGWNGLHLCWKGVEPYPSEGWRKAQLSGTWENVCGFPAQKAGGMCLYNAVSLVIAQRRREEEGEKGDQTAIVLRT